MANELQLDPTGLVAGQTTKPTPTSSASGITGSSTLSLGGSGGFNLKSGGLDSSVRSLFNLQPGQTLTAGQEHQPSLESLITPQEEFGAGIDIEEPIDSQTLGTVTTPPESQISPEDKLIDIQSRVNEIAGKISGLSTQAGQITQPTPADDLQSLIGDPNLGQAGQYVRVPNGIVDTTTGQLIVDNRPPEDTTQISQDIGSQDAYTRYLDEYRERQTGLFAGIKDALGVGEEEESAEAIVDRIMPEVPAKVGQIDKDLANLYNVYQTAIAQRDPATGQFKLGGILRGEQRLLDQQYNIQRNSLLLERDALMGDYDKAIQRANTVLQLELQQRKETREDQKFAANLLIAQATEEERMSFDFFLNQIERQDAADQSAFEFLQEQQKQITDIAKSDPIAFARFVAENGYPNTAQETVLGIGAYTTPEQPEAPTVFGSAKEGRFEQFFNPETRQWEYRQLTGAVQEGIGGEGGVDNLLNQVLQNPATMDFLTLDTKEQLATRAAELGVALPSKPSAEQQKMLTNANSGITAIDRLINNLDRDPSAFKKQPFGIALGTTNRQIQQDKKEAADVITRIRTGAALNEAEQEFYGSYLPGFWDSEESARFKLQTVKSFYQLITANPGQSFPEIKQKMANQLQPGEYLAQALVSSEGVTAGTFVGITQDEYDPNKYLILTP